MATKDQIINNLREYSAADIVQAIRCGEISLYELSKSGKLTPLLKKRIEEQMAAIEDSSTSAKESEPINGESANVSDAVLTETQEITQEIISAPIDSVMTVEAPSVIPTDNRIYEEYVEKQKMFSKPFSFKGRIRRLEYGLSYILFFVWYFLFMMITEIRDIHPMLALIAILSMVPAYWFFWAQGAKRCHDRGNSGWYQIIPFYFLVMIFGPSEQGSNYYGENPKD